MINELTWPHRSYELGAGPSSEYPLVIEEHEWIAQK